MARTDNLKNFLTDVSEAIKQKSGITDLIPAKDFDTEILKLSGDTFYNMKSRNGTYGDYLFYGADLTNFDFNIDTSNMTSLFHAFDNTKITLEEGESNKLIDLSNWNTSNVTNMSYMFDSVSGYIVNPLGWDTSKVTNMSYMFYQSSIQFEGIKNFNTELVTDFSYMFDNSTNFFTKNFFIDTEETNDVLLDFTHWNVSKAINMEEFPCIVALANKNKQGINSIILDVTGWNTSNVTNMRHSFCMGLLGSSLKEIRGELDLDKVTNATGMFGYAANLETVYIKNLGISLSLSYCTKLSKECLVYLINNLKTVTETTTLTLGKTNLAKLTEEEIAVGTSKGWTII